MRRCRTRYHSTQLYNKQRLATGVVGRIMSYFSDVSNDSDKSSGPRFNEQDIGQGSGKSVRAVLEHDGKLWVSEMVLSFAKFREAYCSISQGTTLGWVGVCKGRVRLKRFNSNIVKRGAGGSMPVQFFF